MTFLEIALIILVVALAASLAWVLRLLYRTGVIVLNVQDALEESLEVIDERVSSIDKVLEIPLFSDSQEIKSLRKDMVTCRDSILNVAYSLTNSVQQDNFDATQDAEQR